MAKTVRGKRKSSKRTLSSLAEFERGVRVECAARYRKHSGLDWDDPDHPGKRIFARIAATARHGENERKAREIYQRLREAVAAADRYLEQVDRVAGNVKAGPVGITLDALRFLFPAILSVAEIDKIAAHMKDALGSGRETLALLFRQGFPLAPQGVDVSDGALAVVSILLGLRPLAGDFSQASTVALVIKRETEAFHKLRARRERSTDAPGHHGAPK